MIKIEKNVPMPARHNTVYPLADMAVGDSFVVPTTNVGSVRTLATRFAQRGSMRFKTMKISDSEHRCWRVA